MNKPDLKEGEIYVGAIINADGSGHHIILLGGDIDVPSWQAGMDWAENQGGDLPNRVESALLFNQSKDQFKPEWYWTNEQHASSSVYAWYQGFINGNQDNSFKHNELRARAVRRVVI